MMGIVVPETCWASNKICNKNLWYISRYRNPEIQEGWWKTCRIFTSVYRALHQTLWWSDQGGWEGFGGRVWGCRTYGRDEKYVHITVLKPEARDHVGSLAAEGEVSKRFLSTAMNVRPRCLPLINPPAYSLFTVWGLILTWIIYKDPVRTAQ